MKSSNCTSLWKQKISFGKEPSGKFPVYVKPAFTVYNLNNDEEEHQTEISNIRFQQKRSSSFRVFDIADQSYSSNSWIRRPNGTKLQTSVILISFCVKIFFSWCHIFTFILQIFIFWKNERNYVYHQKLPKLTDTCKQLSQIFVSFWQKL